MGRSRSPLALVLLVLLAEEPAHPYRMHELIRARGKDRVANVASRNSVYQAVERLERLGLIAVRGVDRDAGRPERTVYELTPDGTATMLDWLRGMLSEPAVEYPEFPAALASLLILPPAEVADLLDRRADAVESALDAAKAEVDGLGLARPFLLEEEYAQTVGRAEVAWLRGVVADLRSGVLTWPADWT
ncbi:PadR family transcriptional regulator [Actinokineospora fastidiosa]|uniref:PadR family transcriptional regulator n=1 Tax=Actinokineospora fastidiosa TaxID=1816 RepID=A0A918G8Q1_9PSEU|nr:PadR family transcriptional regulator [Actinokineospora fastidiosa]GGS21358.1 PadR family transcriptional regulator [Actinokineospora fastidiosa]